MDNSRLLESFLEKTQEIAFVKWNGTVVEKSSHCGCHLRNLRKLVFFQAQRAKAFWYSNFLCKFLDESGSLAGSVCIVLGFEAQIQTEHDECHFWNELGRDAFHYREQQRDRTDGWRRNGNRYVAAWSGCHFHSWHRLDVLAWDADLHPQ